MKETGKNMAPASFFKERRTGRVRKGVNGLAEDRGDCNLKVAWTEGEMTKAGS